MPKCLHQTVDARATDGLRRLGADRLRQGRAVAQHGAGSMNGRFIGASLMGAGGGSDEGVRCRDGLGDPCVRGIGGDCGAAGLRQGTASRGGRERPDHLRDALRQYRLHLHAQGRHRDLHSRSAAAPRSAATGSSRATSTSPSGRRVAAVLTKNPGEQACCGGDNVFAYGNTATFDGFVCTLIDRRADLRDARQATRVLCLAQIPHAPLLRL